MRSPENFNPAEASRFDAEPRPTIEIIDTEEGLRDFVEQYNLIQKTLVTLDANALNVLQDKVDQLESYKVAQESEDAKAPEYVDEVIKHLKDIIERGTTRH
jgi:hypothetical protein